MTRIDLNSQGPGITKQDFMERPLPICYEEQFDIISLSLVLNYVPDAVGRGEMLKRADTFLRTMRTDEQTVSPLMFIVLPLPCVNNSRYLDEDRLLAIMRSLKYSCEYKKWTKKLCYYLFSAGAGRTRREKPPSSFEKKMIHDKPGMNNFCIVLDLP